jgi:hypothetical protein
MTRSQKLLSAYAGTALTREVKVGSRAAYGRRLALLYRLGDWCQGKVTTVRWSLALALSTVKEKNSFLAVFADDFDNLAHNKLSFCKQYDGSERNCLNLDSPDLRIANKIHALRHFVCPYGRACGHAHKTPMFPCLRRGVFLKPIK